MVRLSLLKLPHLKLPVSDSDVLSMHGAIQNLSKFESGYSGQWAKNVQFWEVFP